MTTASVVPEVLHPWTIYMRASEEARRRGDRRYGTDHILLVLFEDPSIEAVLGVSLQQARQALESLDQEALGTLGLAGLLQAHAQGDFDRGILHQGEQDVIGASPAITSAASLLTGL